MTTLLAIYVVSGIVWFILASVACYVYWKRGVDQAVSGILGLILTSFIPVLNTYMIFNVLFDMLNGVKLKGKRK